MRNLKAIQHLEQRKQRFNNVLEIGLHSVAFPYPASRWEDAASPEERPASSRARGSRCPACRFCTQYVSCVRSSVVPWTFSMPSTSFHSASLITPSELLASSLAQRVSFHTTISSAEATGNGAYRSSISRGTALACMDSSKPGVWGR